MEIDSFNELTITLSRENTTDDDKRLAICKAVQWAIPKADRVSLWRFNDAKDQIVCLTHRQKDKNNQAVGAVLKAEDYPDYFETILNEKVVNASDARNHPYCKCFNQDYFIPNDIYSLLDYNFHNNFSPIGVICCESTAEIAQWSDEDIAKLKRIANITSMFY